MNAKADNQASIRALNLYAGIGGNRKLWPDTVVVTAVERDPQTAAVYQSFFPNDTVIVADAHEYLLAHYAEFDFIWSSPPCPTHSRMRYYMGARGKRYAPMYPDMTLYQEIIFLQHYAQNAWVVENVIAYYKPLIEPQKVSRHYFWASFAIPPLELPPTRLAKRSLRELEEFLGFDLRDKKLPDKQRALRNCVNPQLGLHVLKASGLLA